MDIVDRILIDQASIEERIKELGEQISRDYEGKTITLVCILKGGLMFLCDLAKHITAPVIYDLCQSPAWRFYSILRRGSITKDLEDSIEGKHVLIVEDIIDTGLTLSYL